MLETVTNIVSHNIFGGIAFGLILGSLGMAYCDRWHKKNYKKIDNKLHKATWQLEDYQKLAVLDETKGTKCSKCKRYLSLDWCLGWERTAEGWPMASTCPYECQP